MNLAEDKIRDKARKGERGIINHEFYKEITWSLYEPRGSFFMGLAEAEAPGRRA